MVLLLRGQGGRYSANYFHGSPWIPNSAQLHESCNNWMVFVITEACCGVSYVNLAAVGSALDG